jgi:hypothetical protein
VYWMIWILPGIVGGFLVLAGAILIRKGQRGGGISFIFAGALTFAFYGVAVNVVPWSFSRLICAYVAAFTLITFIWRQFVFRTETVKSDMAWSGDSRCWKSYCRVWRGFVMRIFRLLNHRISITNPLRTLAEHNLLPAFV